jgi:hypothetical protein
MQASVSSPRPAGAMITIALLNAINVISVVNIANLVCDIYYRNYRSGSKSVKNALVPG